MPLRWSAWPRVCNFCLHWLSVFLSTQFNQPIHPPSPRPPPPPFGDDCKSQPQTASVGPRWPSNRFATACTATAPALQPPVTAFAPSCNRPPPPPAHTHTHRAHKRRAQPLPRRGFDGAPPGAGCIGRGAEPPPPPLQGAQPTPSPCPPDAKCQPQWHLQPTVTAPNRFGNLLQPPVEPPLGPPLRSSPFYCTPSPAPPAPLRDSEAKRGAFWEAGGGFSNESSFFSSKIFCLRNCFGGKAPAARGIRTRGQRGPCLRARPPVDGGRLWPRSCVGGCGDGGEAEERQQHEGEEAPMRRGGQPAQPPMRQLLGAADTQTAHPATFSTAPAHQRLGSANAETTPAGAPAAAADRTQRPDATCEGETG